MTENAKPERPALKQALVNPAGNPHVQQVENRPDSYTLADFILEALRLRKKGQ